MYINSDILGIVLRTSAVYIVIVIFLIMLGKRELSQINITDLVFIMLISNAVQNAMVGSNVSLSGGLIAAFVLFVLNYVFRYLNYKYRFFNKIVEGEPKLLVYEGKVHHDNLRSEKITIEELMAAVREHGVLVIDDVELAMLEVDGSISIVSSDIKRKTKHHRTRKVRTYLK